MKQLTECQEQISKLQASAKEKELGAENLKADIDAERKKHEERATELTKKIAELEEALKREREENEGLKKKLEVSKRLCIHPCPTTVKM